MTKQPSLTSLLDLGLICGPLGDSILDEKISSSPQSPQDNLNGTTKKLNVIERSSSDEKPTNPTNKEEIKPEIKMKIDNISTNVEAAKPDDNDDDNEAGRDEQLASDESASSPTTNTTTTTLKAPKLQLSRNEASISSLSSFFMNNQLKTLNFFYYPSLITKSKWYHASNDAATASAGNQLKQIDDKLDQIQLNENHGKVQ